MRQTFFSSTLIATMAVPLFSQVAQAADIKSGTWETTTSMTGDQLPAQLKGEKTGSECIPGSGKIDVAKLMRDRWAESGCPDIQISRDGNAISAKGQCSMQGRTTTVDLKVTILDDEHYTSTVVTKNDATMTLKETAHWVSPDCQ